MTEHNPNGGAYQRGPVEPSVRPPIPIPEPARPEPRYRYMPSPDNRPWYDNWTKQYVHPFREPGAKSPEPPENTPRYMDPLEPVVVPLPEGSSVPSNPLDSATGLPMPGYWTQGRDGEWTFRTTGDPIRATHIRPGRDGGEEWSAWTSRVSLLPPNSLVVSSLPGQSLRTPPWICTIIPDIPFLMPLRTVFDFEFPGGFCF